MNAPLDLRTLGATAWTGVQGLLMAPLYNILEEPAYAHDAT